MSTVDSIPQGLKPQAARGSDGTAEAVPFPRSSVTGIKAASLQPPASSRLGLSPRGSTVLKMRGNYSLDQFQWNSTRRR